MKKQFRELEVGDLFVFKGAVFTKTQAQVERAENVFMNPQDHGYGNEDAVWVNAETAQGCYPKWFGPTMIVESIQVSC